MSYEIISLIIISKSRSNRMFRIELSSAMRNSLIIEESFESYSSNSVLRRVDLDRDSLIRDYQSLELVRRLLE